ncbi:MAG: hypothetical protein H6811_00915 [Phycisphaeraceae bacterium]|nr:hypothetical protein [Phycisphaeraceae bacterium]
MSRQAGSLARHHFLLRRLHSLTGLVPIGLFLILHLTTNASVLWGAANSRAPGAGALDRGVTTFQEEVSWINSLPGLLLIEIALWVSIAFHAVLGVYYARSGRGNVARYPHMDNWRYTLQRITGYVALVFILYHVATLRWGWTWLVPGGTRWTHEYAASTLAAAIHGSPDGLRPMGVLVSALYMAGITSAVFHFANGLWTMAITWGLTVSIPAQRRWGRVCLALGAGLMLMAWGALVGFLVLDHDRARALEESIHGGGVADPDRAPEE